MKWTGGNGLTGLDAPFGSRAKQDSVEASRVHTVSDHMTKTPQSRFHHTPKPADQSLHGSILTNTTTRPRPATAQSCQTSNSCFDWLLILEHCGLIDDEHDGLKWTKWISFNRTCSRRILLQTDWYRLFRTTTRKFYKFAHWIKWIIVPRTKTFIFLKSFFCCFLLAVLSLHTWRHIIICDIIIGSVSPEVRRSAEQHLDCAERHTVSDCRNKTSRQTSLIHF